MFQKTQGIIYEATMVDKYTDSANSRGGALLAHENYLYCLALLSGFF